MFNNKSILLTGGTGTFGNIFIKETLKKYKPKKLIIFSRDELKQFDMAQEYSDKCLRFFIGDVRDENRLKQAIGDGVDIIVHAAALKQVNTAEYNPTEYIKTNIIGAQNIIQAAISCRVKKVMSLSTDKASNPINLYGITKLASDKLMIAANNISGGKTKFSVTRYGNVSGSRGSVIPLFKKLIDQNSKFLPITDVNMTRFWITRDEAYNFVSNSIENMKGGEIFIPKLPSIKITDLADSFKEKIKKKIIGIRPGEKIHETMFNKEDSRYVIEYKDYYIIKPSINFSYPVNYLINASGQKGRKIKHGFEYNSGTNKKFLKKSELKKLISKTI